ncbi:hypothetical protein ACJW31_08G030800 [Castanea mollissima]
MAAKTLDSNLEFVYQLQMQEAINASLALHNTAASSSRTPPNPRPNDVLEDRKQSEAETRKMKEDLDRRIYDQKLYADIFVGTLRGHGNISIVSTLLFQAVFGMMVNVTGVGVAICDSKDNLILETRKDLEALVNGGVVSSEVAELQALIETLNKALTLELKKRRVPPQQSKIVTLVNQVDLLQRKFTYCNPSLAARDDIKSAFKYARDAIVSQIIWAEETSKGNSKETYCFSCMKQHVEVKLLNDMVAKCRHENCKSEVSIDSCGKFLAPNLVEVKSQRIKESSISPTEKVHCPYPRCSALMSKSEVLQYTKNVYIDAEESGARKCMKCHILFCIKCKAPWHLNMTCYDYKRSNPTAHQGDEKLKSLAKSNRWHQCLKCNHMVELAGGCNHITCRCGYEFCYTCGAKRKNKKATCSCKMWDERNIIYDNCRR